MSNKSCENVNFIKILASSCHCYLQRRSIITFFFIPFTASCLKKWIFFLLFNKMDFVRLQNVQVLLTTFCPPLFLFQEGVSLSLPLSHTHTHTHILFGIKSRLKRRILEAKVYGIAQGILLISAFLRNFFLCQDH